MHDQTNWKTESEIISIKNNNAWGPNKTNKNTDYKIQSNIECSKQQPNLIDKLGKNK